MSTNWLVYWQPDQIARAVADGSSPYVASKQFRTVAKGHVLWVTGRSGVGDLETIGPVEVVELLTRRQAQAKFEKLWDAEYFAIPSASTRIVQGTVLLGPVLPRLRFDSQTSVKLDLTKPLGGQLQRMRRLTPESAKLLKDWWTASFPGEDDFNEIQSELAKWEELDEQAEVWRRREQSFLRKTLFGASKTARCSICETNLPVNLLVAAHIKPRAHCSDGEKRDFKWNVFPLCVLGCDALFERGLIVVKDGIIYVRSTHLGSERLTALLSAIKGKSAQFWSKESSGYFAWHATHRTSHFPD
jgi:hypothetical protein